MRVQNRVIILIWFSVLFCIHRLNSQTVFNKTVIAKHEVLEVIQTQDNGLLLSLLGPLEDTLTADVLKDLEMTFLKLDGSFEEEWQINFGSYNHHDALLSLAEDKDFFWGIGETAERKRMFLVKLDKSGNFIWQIEINKDDGGDSRPSDVQIIDGEVWVFYMKRIRDLYWVPAITVLDKDGNQKNSMHVGFNTSTVMGETVFYNNEIYWQGVIIEDEKTNVLLTKMDLEGNIMWIKEYICSGNVSNAYETKGDIRIDQDHIYLFERLIDTQDLGQEQSVLAMKLTLDGDIIKAKGFKSFDYTTDFHENSVLLYRNEFYIGSTFHTENDVQPALFKMDHELELDWSLCYQNTTVSHKSVCGLFDFGDGFLEITNIRSTPDSNGFSLKKMAFDGRSSCPSYDAVLIENDLTEDFSQIGLTYVQLTGGFSIEVGIPEVLGTDYKTAIYCQDTLYALHRVTEAPFCKGQVIQVKVWGNQGEVSWNLATEDIVSYDGKKLKFILREEEFVLEGTDQVSGEVSMLKIESKCPDSYRPELIVYETISPNNDGLNDYFTIRNIDYYSENSVLIVDQYGTKVLEKQSYQNDWSPEDVPNGIYRYIVFKNSEDKEPEKGTVIIRK